MVRTRRLTRPGLGQVNGRRDSGPPPKSGIVCPPPVATERKSSESIVFRPTEPPPAPDPAPDARTTGKRPRPSIREDDVGAAAMKLGSGAPLTARPRLARSRKELETAPIDHREAFVLSLIDGKTTVQSLVDVAALPEKDVLAILARLRRLGIITYGAG
jgi:hypothetical protein